MRSGWTLKDVLRLFPVRGPQFSAHDLVGGGSGEGVDDDDFVDFEEGVQALSDRILHGGLEGFSVCLDARFEDGEDDQQAGAGVLG